MIKELRGVRKWSQE